MALFGVGALVASSCSSDPILSDDAVDLAAVCPNPVVIALGSAMGSSPPFDGLVDERPDSSGASALVPLTAEGRSTGVDLEIRFGSSREAEAGERPIDRAFSDPSIVLFQLGSVEGYRTFEEQPALSVLALLDRSPKAIVWDGAANSATSIDELAGPIAMPTLDPAGRHLVFLGILDESSVVDLPDSGALPSGAAARLVDLVEQPALYGADTRTQVLHELEWEAYENALAVRADRVETLRPCLLRLVPVLQLLLLDHATTDEAAVLVAEGIVGNGVSAVVGDFDGDRMERVYELFGGLFPEVGPITPPELMTNEFLNPAIGLEQ